MGSYQTAWQQIDLHIFLKKKNGMNVVHFRIQGQIMERKIAEQRGFTVEN